MTKFEEKRQAKIERFQGLSEKFSQESDKFAVEASKMADIIPMGQPILIGHHSEKRDRNYRNKIGDKFRKSLEFDKKSEYYAERAKAMEQNTAIFTDDPEADEKLQEKIEKLERQQELMKAFNRLLKKNDIEGLLDLGFSESQIEKLKKPDFCGRVGFADYKLVNNGANIRRLKKRLEHIGKLQNAEITEKEINGVRIVDNVEENRLQLFFPDKPNEEIRRQLKSSGFRWSPSNGCWQAYRSNGHSAHKARIILQSIQLSK